MRPIISYVSLWANNDGPQTMATLEAFMRFEELQAATLKIKIKKKKLNHL